MKSKSLDLVGQFSSLEGLENEKMGRHENHVSHVHKCKYIFSLPSGQERIASPKGTTSPLSCNPTKVMKSASKEAQPSTETVKQSI